MISQTDANQRGIIYRGPVTDAGANPQPSRPIPEFDILRSIAILLLFLHHSGTYSYTVLGFPLSSLSRYIELFLLGSFIFMSGYLSVRSLEKTSLVTFMASKLVRIYIPYLAALVLFILFLDVEVSKLDFLTHLLGAQMLFSPRWTSPIFTLWFVGLILVYYFLFGVLVKRIRSTPFLLAALLLIFLTAFLIRVEYQLIARRFFYYFFVFAAGIILAQHGWLDRLLSKRYFLLDKFLFALIGVFLYSFYVPVTGQDVSLPMVAAILLYIISMILLVISVARWFVERRMVNLKLFSLISYSSFFAYLFHRIIWKALLSIAPFTSTTGKYLFLILVGTVVVLGLSYILQTIYNRFSLANVRPRLPVLRL